ncbi:MAG TPA: hypothetical protein VFO36_06275, partial [Nitrospiraceae bacterium]|nr:hypothetical protein [Nitrospiraceae bacterium]
MAGGGAILAQHGGPLWSCESLHGAQDVSRCVGLRNEDRVRGHVVWPGARPTGDHDNPYAVEVVLHDSGELKAVQRSRH